MSVIQQRNLLWIPTPSKCGPSQPMTWTMTMWWVPDVEHKYYLYSHKSIFLLQPTFLSPSRLLCFSSRIWWTRMLCWMKMTWRSQTQLLLKHPAVEERPRRKPARTGEAITQMFLTVKNPTLFLSELGFFSYKCVIWKAFKHYMTHNLLYFVG